MYYCMMCLLFSVDSLPHPTQCRNNIFTLMCVIVFHMKLSNVVVVVFFFSAKGSILLYFIFICVISIFLVILISSLLCFRMLTFCFMLSIIALFTLYVFYI